MIPTNAIVIVPARDGDMAAISPGGSKARIPINGRPAISYVIDNLRACDLISSVTLVCDKATYELAPDADTYVEANGDETSGILAGARAANGAGRCLVISGDMPLASPEAIGDFLACAPDCDVVYPVVERNDVEDFFPGRKAHYVGAREGHFTGSSILLFRPEVALSRDRLLATLLNARRDPASLVGLLGPALAFKLMLSTLSVGDFEESLSTALGVNCRVFVSHYPELILSIDSPEDITLIEAELNV
ncbi:MAG: nucleotidyltransferase family protein [Armatimonadetes bacterium]|nr:nucleotidyltransferase family protein [Armatimonadota bacterium]